MAAEIVSRGSDLHGLKMGTRNGIVTYYIDLGLVVNSDSS